MCSETKPNTRTFKTPARLLKPSQFNTVFTKPDLKISNKHILLLARKSPLTYARLGLVVAKKKIPLSVNRNRFKRLAREYFRTNKGALGSFDIVILCRNDMCKLTKKEQNQNFSQIFSTLYKKNEQQQEKK